MKEVDALNGLRALASLHVMLGHYINIYIRGSQGIDIHPASEMPLFYLLSGYCLALNYCKTADDNTAINQRAFFIKRFGRLAPMYYLVNALLFMSLASKSSQEVLIGKDLSLWTLMTFSCTNTWFSWLWIENEYLPFSEFSWTVNTLFFFYLTFPTLLNYFKPCSVTAIKRLMIMLCAVQSIPCLFIWINFGVDVDAFEYFYCNFTQNPLTRLPVFAMGILGGIQTTRWRTHIGEGNSDGDFNKKEKILLFWKRLTDICALLFTILIVSFSRHQHNFSLRKWTYGYSQLLLVPLQLIIIIGLSRAGERSLLGKLCNTSFLQFVGGISMVLYLIHVHTTEIYWLAPQLSFMYYKNQGLEIFLDICLLSGTSIYLAYILQEIFVNPVEKSIRKIFI